MMRDALKRFNEAFEEGTLAFSDRIVGLTDDELWETDIDPDTETLPTTGDLRKPARGGGRTR